MYASVGEPVHGPDVGEKQHEFGLAQAAAAMPGIHVVTTGDIDMYRRVTALLALTLTSLGSAEEFRTGPLIEDFGPVIAVDGKDITVDTERRYRLVFDAAASDGEDALNREFETVARFLNMHALNGVPPANMDIKVVVHGEALMSVLEHGPYRRRFGRDNPSLELVSRLADAGVEFLVCGQSMGFRDVLKEELSDSAQVGLSAMTMLAVYQADGYALIP